MKKNFNKIIAVVGPTASGKTAYSIELAKEINGEIISADSRLVYRDMNIGTAKPTLKERQDIPHYMIDIAYPNVDYSVGLYAIEAKKYIKNILSRGKTPIIVGGTGLYLNVLLMNYDLPKVEPNYDLREQLKNENNLYEILQELDQETAGKIERNDRKKIIRAIEIIKATGEKISATRGYGCKEYDISWIGKNFDRNELYDRINRRVDLMMEMGLLNETKTLLEKYGRINNLLYTIGYQEMISYIDNKCSLEDAVNKLKQNTRNYAKRQLTWFRKNNDINWDCYPSKLNKKGIYETIK